MCKRCWCQECGCPSHQRRVYHISIKIHVYSLARYRLLAPFQFLVKSHINASSTGPINCHVYCCWFNSNLPALHNWHQIHRNAPERQLEKMVFPKQKSLKPNHQSSQSSIKSPIIHLLLECSCCIIPPISNTPLLYLGAKYLVSAPTSTMVSGGVFTVNGGRD